MDLDNLEWDSRHFGIRVGRLNLASRDEFDAVARALRNQQFDCVIARQNLGDLEAIHSLETLGFRLMDVRVNLSLDVGLFRRLPPQSRAVLRPFEERDLTAVMALARRSFWSDHFHNDRRFDRDRVNEMYAEWVMKCVREGYTIEVAELNSTLAGFLAAILREDELYIELVAVDEAFRGRGIGEDLLVRVLTESDRRTRSVSVDVQLSNSAAIKIYGKLGFRVVGSQVTLHWWPSA